jgi:flavodoxin
MKILLLYYSGAGNTKYIANIVEESLNQKQHNVKSIKITESSINSLENEYDLLFLGFPVYFRDAPELVYRAIEKLSKENMPALVFLTKGLYSGNAYKNVHEKLVVNKFLPIGYIELFMPGTDLLTLAINENSFLEKIAVGIHSMNIGKRINRFLEKINANKTIEKVKKKWYTIFDDNIVKKMEMKADDRHRDWIKYFVVNKVNCIQCMKCIKGCPRNNIGFNDVIFFNKKCDVCFYCINNCPIGAISLSKIVNNKVRYSEEKINKIFDKKGKPASNNR